MILYEEVVDVDRLNKKTEWLCQEGKSGCCEETAIGDSFDCIQKLALTVSQQKTNYNKWVTQIFPLSHACNTSKLQLLIKKSQALLPVTFQSNSKCTLVKNAIIVTVHVNLTNLLNWWTSNDLLIFFRVSFHHQVIHLFVIFLNLGL